MGTHHNSGDLFFGDSEVEHTDYPEFDLVANLSVNRVSITGKLPISAYCFTKCEAPVSRVHYFFFFFSFCHWTFMRIGMYSYAYL